MRTKELMLYKHMEHEELLRDMTFLMENCDSDYYNKEDMAGLLFECVNELLELAAGYGFEGNLWHNYLTFLLVNDENAYSTECEIVGEIEGSINTITLHDFEIFRELFAYDFTILEKALGVNCLSVLMHYENVKGHGKVFNKRIRDRICELSEKLGTCENAEEFKCTMTQFYKEFGVGKFGLHKAFRIEHTEVGADIVPITKIAHVHLDDLVGYEIAKKKLIENTEAFVKGKKANNCLLFGDAGTGKSTSIKALKDMYRNGENFTFLMPAAEAIYLPHDFRTVYEQEKRYFHGEGEPLKIEEAGELAKLAGSYLSAHYQVYAKRDAAYY